WCWWPPSSRGPRVELAPGAAPRPRGARRAAGGLPRPLSSHHSPWGPSWRAWGRRGPHLEHAPRGATRASGRSSSPPAGEGDHGRGHALALPCPHLAPAVLRPRGQLPPLPFLPQPLGALPRVPLDLLAHEARRFPARPIGEVGVAGRGLRALVSKHLADLREREPGLGRIAG